MNDDIEQLRRDLLQYQRLVYNADQVARGRGDRFGLCDCINNVSDPYPSQWAADLIKRVREDLAHAAQRGEETDFGVRLLRL